MHIAHANYCPAGAHKAVHMYWKKLLSENVTPDL